jgi:uncharacterized membrane protein HdeD (DUF308 family)
MSNGRPPNTATQSHRVRTLPAAVRERSTALSVVQGARVRAEIRRPWVPSVVVGVAVMVLGFVALGAIGFATLASAGILGRLLVLAGIMQTMHAFRVRRRGGFTRHLLAGVLSLVAGVLMVANPAASARSLALFVAAFFMVGGIFRIAAARSFRFPGRRYAVTSDVLTMLLAMMIGVEWPVSGVWAVVTFVGLDLILDGWSLVMAGVAAQELGHRADRHLRLVRRTSADEAHAVLISRAESGQCPGS